MQLAFMAIMSSMLFTACVKEDSSDVNQDKIYTDYEVFYNSNTDKTWVVAKFRFGGATGTILELTDPASVTFNGDTLPYNFLFTGHYKEYAGRLETGRFSYTNVNGDVFVNDIPAYETVAFPNNLDTISKSQAYDLIWDGTALSANQTVGIFIGTPTWGQDALVIQANEGSNNIVLGTTALGNLATGVSTCYMDRATAVDVAEGTSEGGRIRGKFRASNKSAVIVE